MKGIKIVTIGGGSSYTPELVEGFIKRYDKLPVRELWLVDIEAGKEKLEIVGALAKRMVEKAGVDMEIYLTLDRRAALKDADFVTTQFRVGRLPARIKDERIPLSHGLMGQETNGAGGLFKALRTIPVILNIVEDMKELCPDAWLINFTNPSGIINEAVLRYGNFPKVVGLCNCAVTMESGIAKILKCDAQDVRLQIAGLNHHFFVTDVFVKGVSKMKEALMAYEGLNEDDFISMKNIFTIPWSKELLRGIQAIPCSYLSYYFFQKEQLEHQLIDYAKGNVRSEFVTGVEEELFALYKDPNLDIKPKQLEQRGGAMYSDAACNLICSIYNDTKDIQYVNCRNDGAIANLPHESGVEIAAIITADGPKPIALGDLPVAINGTIQNIKTFERMAVEAAVHGDRDIAIAALTLNPLVTSDKLAKIVFEELLEAHKEYLPQFRS